MHDPKLGTLTSKFSGMLRQAKGDFHPREIFLQVHGSDGADADAEIFERRFAWLNAFAFSEEDCDDRAAILEFAKCLVRLEIDPNNEI